MTSTTGARTAAHDRLVRHEPGTSSPTVSTIRLADGTRPYVDLVRLNPGLAAYALDHPGVAPDGPVGYRVDRTAVDPRVRRILLGSHPHVPLTELSRRLRAAGHDLGVADLREHEAISATQAAIWAVSAGAQLEVHDRATPTAARYGRAGGGHAVSVALELAAPTVLRGYEVRLGTPHARVHLEASPDGVVWRVVAGSSTSTSDGRVSRGLPPLATVATSVYPSRARGYRHYRVVAEPVDGATEAIVVGSVRVLPARGHRFANATPVVELYRYLLALADRADPVEDLVVAGPEIVDTPPGGGLVGPFAVTDPHGRGDVAVRVAGAARAVDRRGRAITTVASGEPFWVHVPAGPDRRFVVEATGALAAGADVHRLVADPRPDGSAGATTLVAVVPAQVARAGRLAVDHLTLVSAVRTRR